METGYIREILLSFAKSGFLPHELVDKEVEFAVEEWILETFNQDCIYGEEE